MAIDLPIQKDNVDSRFSHMERHIDLNKHAFDLNEVPLIDLNVGFLHDGASSSSSSSLLHHGVMNATSCPKKGGWLELFQNMFGHESARNPQVFVPMLGTNSAILNPLDRFNIGAIPNPNYRGLNGTIHNPRDQCANGSIPNLRDRCGINAITDPRRRYTNDATAKLRHQYVKDDMPDCRDRCGIGDILNPNDRCVNSAIPNLNDRCVNDAIPNLNDRCLNNAFPNLNDLCIDNAIMNLNDRCINDAILNPDRNLIQNHNESLFSKHGDHMDGSLSGLQKLSSSHRGSRKRSRRDSSHGPFLPFAHLVESTSSYRAFGQDDIMLVNKLGHEDIGSNTSREYLVNGENPNKAPLHLDLNSQPLPSWDLELYGDSSMCLEQNRGIDSFRDNGESPCNSGKTSEPILSNNMPETPVKIIESPEWLPSGWITELKTRKAGSTAGSKDKYYKDPVTGRRFRSRNEVASFLETVHGCKYKSHIQFMELPIPTDPVSASLLPNQDYSKDSLESSRFPFGKYSMETGSFPYRKDSAESTSFTCWKDSSESGRFPYRKDLTEGASLFLDVSPNTMGSSNASLERISVKQEQDVMRDEQMGCSSVAIESCQAGVLYKSHHNSSKEDHNLFESSDGPGSQNKRRKLSHKSQGSASGHIPFECKLIQEQSGSEWWKKEPKEASEDGKDMHLNHLSLQEQSKAQTHDYGHEQFRIQSFPKTNGNLSSLKVMENVLERVCERESCPKPSPGNKAPGRKIPKLTLKQERELLISLGQKLCRRVFAPPNERSL